jgi:hypothetical protein
MVSQPQVPSNGWNGPIVEHVRTNGVKGEQIEQFVLALSGKNLSVQQSD